jgi:hypothetical protein
VSAQYLVHHIFVYCRDQNLPDKSSDIQISRHCFKGQHFDCGCGERNISHLFFAAAPHHYFELGQRRGAGYRLRYFLQLSHVRNTDRAGSRTSPFLDIGVWCEPLGRRKLIPILEHVTWRDPTVTPTRLAISSRLIPTATKPLISSITCGVNLTRLPLAEGLAFVIVMAAPLIACHRYRIEGRREENLRVKHALSQPCVANPT